MAATAARGRVTAARCRAGRRGSGHGRGIRDEDDAGRGGAGQQPWAPGPPPGIAAEPPCQRELREDEAGVDQAADRVMRVAIPPCARLTGRVEQHVVAAQQDPPRPSASRHPGRGQPPPAPPGAFWLSASRSAAPNANVHPPSTRKPASMICGSRAPGAARQLSCRPPGPCLVCRSELAIHAAGPAIPVGCQNCVICPDLRRPGLGGGVSSPAVRCRCYGDVVPGPGQGGPAVRCRAALAMVRTCIEGGSDPVCAFRAGTGPAWRAGVSCSGHHAGSHP